MTAYGVLSRGLLSGSKPEGAQGSRSHLSRFSGENHEKNQRRVAVLINAAKKHNATASQVTIAWVVAKNASIIPVIGTRKRTQLAEELGVVLQKFAASDIAAIEAAMATTEIASARYDASLTANLDSEKT